MANLTETCPQPFDIEPTCYSFDPEAALKHPRGILKIVFPERTIGDIEGMIKSAVAFVIPSKVDPNKYLYGLRSPDSREFPNAWGLPSTGLLIESFRGLVNAEGKINTQEINAAISKMLESKGQITSETLIPQDIIGWTGRLRGPNSGFATDYYLLMVDVRTQPIDPDSVARFTDRYTEFAWLSPQEHMKMVEQTPSKACGACSALVYDYSKKST